MHALLRRELFAPLATPLGGVVLIAFHLLAVGLYAPDFFMFPTADMRSFFAILPFVLCAFVPAITMRLWAEERAQGTLELLMVLPVRPWTLVMSKFLGALAFVLLALASTTIIPFMLGMLGSPDWGQLATAYLGAILLSAMLLAVGQLMSGFATDQASAFVLGLMGCFGLYLLGSDFAATALDSWHHGLGSLLRQAAGAAQYYTPFTRGVIQASGVLFFMTWTSIFLLLNGLAMENRGRQRFAVRYSAAVLCCLTIGACTALLASSLHLPRWDLTQGRIHSLSPATATILQRLDAPIQLTYYVTPADQMPTELKHLEQDVMDRLEEIKAQAPDKVRIQRVYLQAANVLDETTGGELERRMLAKGVQPISVAAIRQTGTVTELVYSSLGIAFREKPEEILPATLPDTLGQLEYAVAATVLRLARPTPPTVALVTGQGQFDGVRQLLESEGYTVRSSFFSAHDPLPKADAIVLLQPVLSERQRWELARALAQGAKIFVAAQNEIWDYNQFQGRVQAIRVPLEHGLEPWLAPYGVRLAQGILMDEHTIAIRVATNPLAAVTGNVLSLRLPTHMVLTRDHMAQHPLTDRLDTLIYLWGSALEEGETNPTGLTRTPLVWTSPRAWLSPVRPELSPEAITPPQEGRRSFPAVIRITGNFPAPEGPVPQWDNNATPEAPLEPISPAPGELLVMGSASSFSEGLLTSNAELLLSAVDAMVYGEELLSIRPKSVPSRALPPLSPQTAVLWKILLHGLPPFLVLTAATIRMLHRRARRRTML